MASEQAANWHISSADVQMHNGKNVTSTARLRLRWRNKAMLPGVLRNSIAKYTHQDPGSHGLYVVDNTEPYDYWFPGPEGLFQPPNNPQPLDDHIGRSYGSRCYRSPWNGQRKLFQHGGIPFPEPAFLAASFGPRKICFDQKGERCDAELTWKFDYYYDIPKWGDEISDGNAPQRILPLPEIQWWKDDRTMVAAKQAEVKARMAKEHHLEGE